MAADSLLCVFSSCFCSACCVVCVLRVLSSCCVLCALRRSRREGAADAEAQLNGGEGEREGGKQRRGGNRGRRVDWLGCQRLLFLPHVCVRVCHGGPASACTQPGREPKRLEKRLEQCAKRTVHMCATAKHTIKTKKKHDSTFVLHLQLFG